MTARLLVAGAALALWSLGLSAQGKPLIVVNPFTTAPDVLLPYDLKGLQAQMVAELKVLLPKQFDFAANAPESPSATQYALDVQITGWRAGNAAKRILVGMGSGRESADIVYSVSDSAGKKVLERKDTIRTQFYSQGAGSVGTLAHPFALKISDRLKATKLP